MVMSSGKSQRKKIYSQHFSFILWKLLHWSVMFLSQVLGIMCLPPDWSTQIREGTLLFFAQRTASWHCHKVCMHAVLLTYGQHFLTVSFIFFFKDMWMLMWSKMLQPTCTVSNFNKKNKTNEISHLWNLL